MYKETKNFMLKLAGGLFAVILLAIGSSLGAMDKIPKQELATDFLQLVGLGVCVMMLYTMLYNLLLHEKYRRHRPSVIGVIWLIGTVILEGFAYAFVKIAYYREDGWTVSDFTLAAAAALPVIVFVLIFLMERKRKKANSRL